MFDVSMCGTRSRNISAGSRDRGEAIGSLASVGARHGLLLRWAMGVTVSKRWLAGSAAAAPGCNPLLVGQNWRSNGDSGLLSSQD